MKLIKKIVRSLYKRMWEDEFVSNCESTVYKADLFLAKDLVPIYINNWDFSCYLNDDFSVTEKLKILQKGMDEKSKVLVELVAKYYSFLQAAEIFQDKIYLERSFCYNQEKHNKNYKLYKNKYDGKLPFDAYESSVFLYHCGLTEVPKEVLEYIKGKDFLDCGACFGDSGLVFSEYSPNKIYGFEPVTENLNYMKQTININSLENVLIPVPFAVGDKNEKINITIMGSGECGMGNVINLKTGVNTEEINITTIDDYLSGKDINPALIKMDLEGYETPALNGAIKTIKKYRPVLLISVYHNLHDFFEIKPWIESLNLNYKFMFRNLKDLELLCDNMLIAYPAELNELEYKN